MSDATPRDRYRELVARVDAFFARVHAAHRAAMRCGPGCDGCCRAGPTVTPIEAEAIRRWLADATAETRAALERRARADLPNRCVALDESGRCLVYPARPLICRSHGLPIRMRDADGVPFVATCLENFTTGLPGDEMTLDQETLSTILLALNRALAPDALEEPQRVALRELLLRVLG